MQQEPLGWRSGRVSNSPGLHVPLRRRSPWSSSIAHHSFDAVEGSLEVGAAPGARLIGDLVRDDAGQLAEIVLKLDANSARFCPCAKALARQATRKSRPPAAPWATRSGQAPDAGCELSP